MKVSAKTVAMYPTERKNTPLKSNRTKHNPTKLRSSIKVGSILILLSGRFAGNRVVCLGQLDSGLLLVTGPYKINGVPLHRVMQSRVQPTSTVLPLEGVDVSAVSEEWFKKPRAKAASTEEEFMEDAENKRVLAPEFLSSQKALDAFIMPKVAAIPNMKKYLKSKFALTKGQRFHEMRF
ncbi:60S ribosomal protein L6E [Kipferlia bialata]|uniref:60S ribosomal protein L6E n=1 Tax=Kipferlia bialata TaxID=797122 RepID=A0A391NWG3_9EUKA|nr:60S ribosomal protein L6E [Kipferlia bialata]|eukprot:g5888.t1